MARYALPHRRKRGEYLQKIFLKMWNKVSGQNVHSTEFWRYKKKDYLVENLKPDTTATAYRKMVGIINREPHITKDIIRYFYVNAINDAQDSIKIISPYFTLSHKLKRH